MSLCVENPPLPRQRDWIFMKFLPICPPSNNFLSSADQSLSLIFNHQSPPDLHLSPPVTPSPLLYCRKALHILHQPPPPLMCSSPPLSTFPAFHFSSTSKPVSKRPRLSLGSSGPWSAASLQLMRSSLPSGRSSTLSRSKNLPTFGKF